MYNLIKEKFEKIVADNNLSKEAVVIKAKPLTPEEAIGNPESEDFVILKGQERLIQAEFQGSFGQAFTDMYGDFDGTIEPILEMAKTKTVFYGISIAGVARLFGLERFCPRST